MAHMLTPNAILALQSGDVELRPVLQVCVWISLQFLKLCLIRLGRRAIGFRGVGG